MLVFIFLTLTSRCGRIDVMIEVGQKFNAGTDGNGEIQVIQITRVGRIKYWFRYITLDRRIVDSYNKHSFEALLEKGLVVKRQ